MTNPICVNSLRYAALGRALVSRTAHTCTHNALPGRVWTSWGSLEQHLGLAWVTLLHVFLVLHVSMVFHFVTGNNVVVHATQLRFRFLCSTRPSVLGFRARHGFEDKHVFCGVVRK